MYLCFVAYEIGSLWVQDNSVANDCIAVSRNMNRMIVNILISKTLLGDR